MSKFLLALGLLAALLAGCAAAGGAVAPASDEATPIVTIYEPPLEPVVATLPGYPGVADTSYPGQEPVAPAPVAPAHTDLSQVTPGDGYGGAYVAPTPGRPSDPVTAADGRLLEATVDDLSAHLDVPPGSISLVSVEHVIWSDTSLGCPKPGVDYAQVQVEGSVIILASGVGEYAYHTDGARAFVLCKDGRLISEGVVIER